MIASGREQGGPEKHTGEFSARPECCLFMVPVSVIPSLTDGQGSQYTHFYVKFCISYSTVVKNKQTNM